jgi:DNA polymerase-4
MAHYAQVSGALMHILHRMTPAVEPLSLDEAFLDVTAERRLYGDGETIARAIKQSVAQELELSASVGVASCKLVAKVASDLSKPNGLRVVAAGTERTFLAPLPVGRLLGVGRKTEAVLLGSGLRTIGDVAACGVRRLGDLVGERLAAHLLAMALGDDPREVVAERDPVTVGSEETFADDTRDTTWLGVRILVHADDVAERLRRGGYRARVVVLKVKYADFTIRTRRQTLPGATSCAQVIARAARELLDRVDLSRPLRLIGVTAAGLEADAAPRQLALDLAPGRTETAPAARDLGHTLDAIADRFGSGVITRATLLEPKR